MRFLYIIIFTFLVAKTYAQDTSWRAKLIVYSAKDEYKEGPSKYHDTVYIGVHERGGAGFQQDLDIIDTAKRRSPIDVRSGDAKLSQELGLPCARLKSNIKHYRKSPVVFDMYVQFDYSAFEDDDELWLKIDTSDFIWQRGKYKVLAFKLTAINGYIGDIDRKDITLVNIFEDRNSFIDSVKLLPEGFYNSCNSARQFYFQAKVSFEPIVGLDQEPESQTITSIYPNPFTDEVNIGFNEPYSGQIQVYDILGRVVYCTNARNTNHEKIAIGNLHKGIYTLRFTDKQTQQVYIKKIVKN